MVLNGRYFFQGSIFGQNLEIMLKITPKMFPIDQKKYSGIDGLDHNWQELERNYVLNQSKKHLMIGS